MASGSVSPTEARNLEASVVFDNRCCVLPAHSQGAPGGLTIINEPAAWFLLVACFLPITRRICLQHIRQSIQKTNTKKSKKKSKNNTKPANVSEKKTPSGRPP